MSEQAQSIMQGSADLTSKDIGGFRITDAVFPAGLTLDSHYHERACFAVVLEGSVDKTFRGKEFALPASTVVTMPPEERHADYFERAGAHMLVIEPAPHTEELLRPCSELLDRINHFQHGGVLSIAWRLSQELYTQDDLSRLALEGLVLEVLATAARRNETTRSNDSRPPWLDTARDILHEQNCEADTVAEVAELVGVHPVHLARVFREHYGVSPGTYMRRLRLDFAATQLAISDETLSSIARCAGFTDQSHFTRAFKRHTGFTPGKYRRLLRQ